MRKYLIDTYGWTENRFTASQASDNLPASIKVEK
jgi:hypothetical protein